MRLRIVALLGAAALLIAACTSAADSDETRAEAATDRSSSDQPASPTSANDDDSNADGSADGSEDADDQTDATDTDDDSAGTIETSTSAAPDADSEHADEDERDGQDPTAGGEGEDGDESNEAASQPDRPTNEDQDPADEDTEDQDPEDQDPEDQDTEDQDPEDQDTKDQDPEDQDTEDQDPESTVDVGLTGPGSATAGLSATLVPAEQGDSGDEVLALQRRLAELGFAPGTPDGSYGRRTVAAVEAFQGLVDLEPTGEADTETITALAKYRYDGLVLHAGDEGTDVETLQFRLSEGPFDPGPIDGAYGTGTVQAVWALEKLAGIPVDGDWGPLDEKAWQRLADGEIGAPEKEHDERWVEVDLSQQIMKVYDPESSTPTLISHASSGSGIPWKNEDHSGSSITPTGDFEIGRRISGWRESSLNIGRLYNPLYFNGGIAFHGASSVPLYPASHGCIRLPMHVAEYLPGELPNGTPVHVLK